MSVRPAIKADLPTVIELIRQLWEAHDEDDYDDASLAARAAEILAHCDCYVLDADDAPIAFASLKDQGDYMLIRHFSLEKSKRGVGLGRAAFSALEAHAFPGRKSRLYASTTHPGPRAFWEKMGYCVFAHTMERKAEARA